MAYGEKVIDHYENPRNVGSFNKADVNIGTGMVGAPACGDVMKLQIKVNEQGIIEDAKFKTYGCGSAIASSSLLTEWVKGKTLDEARPSRTLTSPLSWICRRSRCIVRYWRKMLSVPRSKITRRSSNSKQATGDMT